MLLIRKLLLDYWCECVYNLVSFFFFSYFLSLVAAPDLLDPKTAIHNSKPRLSFSAQPVLLKSPEDFEPRVTVMRWKTVLSVFLLVVLYLILGATVFKELEQPHETSQKLAILVEKLEFLEQHPCVNSTDLEYLVKVKQLTCTQPTYWTEHILGYLGYTF